MKINKLKAKMVEQNISIVELSELVGVDKSTMYRRFTNSESFSIKEAGLIANILNLTADELNEIFFNEIVADKR